MTLTIDLIRNGVKNALVSRGKNKGMLKAKCPKMGTPEAAVWQAIVSFANPFKIGMAHMMFMSHENRELYNHITKIIEISGLDVRSLDRDRKALDSLGVW